MRNTVTSAAVLLLLLLPLLAEALPIQRIGRSLKSFQRRVASSRQLLQFDIPIDDSISFTSGAKLYNHECWPTPNADGCTYNSRMLLAKDAPEPVSEAGKWLAKLIGATHLCEVHPTLDSCVADTEANCDVAEVIDVVNRTVVQICTLSDAASASLINDYFLCPGSLMQKVFKCGELQARLNTTNLTAKDGCYSGDGVTCVPAVDSCMPAELTKAYNLTDPMELAKLDAAVGNVSESVWGCCPGVKVYAQQQECAAELKRASCSGKCKWFSDEDSVDPAQLAFSDQDPPCQLRRDAMRDLVMADVNTAFATYLKEVQARCEKIKVNNTMDAGKCFNTSDIQGGVSAKKAKTFSELVLTRGGGPNPLTCSTGAQTPSFPPPAVTPVNTTTPGGTTSGSGGTGGTGSSSGTDSTGGSSGTGSTTTPGSTASNTTTPTADSLLVGTNNGTGTGNRGSTVAASGALSRGVWREGVMGAVVASVVGVLVLG